MPADPDTVMTAVSVLIDELYQIHIAPHVRVRRRPRPVPSDSKVLTLLLLSQ